VNETIMTNLSPDLRLSATTVCTLSTVSLSSTILSGINVAVVARPP
jgi:hypothetical protein